MEVTFSSSSTARNFCHWKTRDLPPVFGVLLLDARHALIRFESFYRKTGQSGHQLQKEVVESVLAARAAAVILMQNYPSTPGDDILQRVRSSLTLIGVGVLDHIIVSKSESISLRERGLLGKDEEESEMIGKRPDYCADSSKNVLDCLRGKPCCLPFSHPEYQSPGPEQVDILIRGMGWSQSDASKIVGVAYDAKKGSTTLRKWRSPKDSSEYREIPYSAWRLLLVSAGLAIPEEK